MIPELILVAGARPNFMKIAPILRSLRKRADAFRPVLVHTGQHYDEQMSEVFFRQLEIPAPDEYLGVGSGSHGAQTARVLESFERVLLARRKNLAGVIVVGDVNSTLACTLAAVKLGVPVAHVEAGLRSFDRSMPEEINRIVTDSISDLLMVSEPTGETNLLGEGIDPKRIRYVGNVMIDTLAHELQAAKLLDIPKQMNVSGKQYALATIHRAANVDDPEKLKDLFGWLARMSLRIDIILPMHPRTKMQATQLGLLAGLESSRRIQVTEPLGYRENVSLMSDATVVLTDSGGIQEETSFLGVPCLTLRPNTERPCTVTHGTNTIVGGDFDYAEALVSQVLEGRYKRGKQIPGWDGCASERILDTLIDLWVKTPETTDGKSLDHEYRQPVTSAIRC